MKYSEMRQELLQLFVSRGAVQFGDFTLASGKKSDFYIDSRKILLNGHGLHLAFKCLSRLACVTLTSNLVELHTVTAVGGLASGSIAPTAAFLLQDGGLIGIKEGFFVRSEAKAHGTRNKLEGLIGPEDKVLILDDVLTTGGSALKAIEAVEAVGAKVVLVMCLVDRLEGGREALMKYPLASVFTRDDFSAWIDPTRKSQGGDGATLKFQNGSSIAVGPAGPAPIRGSDVGIGDTSGLAMVDFSGEAVPGQLTRAALKEGLELAKTVQWPPE